VIEGLPDRHDGSLNILHKPVACHGKVVSWHLHAGEVVDPVHILYTDIWRHLGGDQYMLVGKNRLEITSNGSQVV